MRISLIATTLALILSVAACGGNDTTAGGVDLAASNDLSVGEDQSVPAIGCYGLIFCLSKCGADKSCQAECQGKASQAGLLLLNELSICSVKACSNPTDGGAAPCMSLQDTSAACNACTQKLGFDLAQGKTDTCKLELDNCKASP